MARRVLVVDDSNTVVSQISKLLKESGEFEVVGSASNADEAIKKYQELKPDLVTMDMVMPGIDPVEAIKKIMAADPKARVVVVSSLGGVKEKVVAALSAGAKNVIAKPFEKDVVLKVLRAVP